MRYARGHAVVDLQEARYESAVIRQDRILDEAQATGGDVRRVCDLFGLSIASTYRYPTTMNPPASPTTSTPPPAKNPRQRAFLSNGEHQSTWQALNPTKLMDRLRRASPT